MSLVGVLMGKVMLKSALAHVAMTSCIMCIVRAWHAWMVISLSFVRMEGFAFVPLSFIPKAFLMMVAMVSLVGGSASGLKA